MKAITKFSILSFLSFLLIGCPVPMSQIKMDHYSEDYTIGELKTIKMSETMLSKKSYKNSCYSYIALMDYETPSAGALGTAKIKKGDQEVACFGHLSDPNYVLIKGVHVYTNIFLKIQKDGFIGENGGWYMNGINNMFQGSWTKDKLFELSKDKFYPGFDSFIEKLIYLGFSEGKVRIGYRLISYNSSKPGESQDLIYELNADKTIHCFGYTLKIADVDNNKISFIIVDDKKEK